MRYIVREVDGVPTIDRYNGSRYDWYEEEEVHTYEWDEAVGIVAEWYMLQGQRLLEMTEEEYFDGYL